MGSEVGNAILRPSPGELQRSGSLTYVCLKHLTRIALSTSFLSRSPGFRPQVTWSLPACLLQAAAVHLARIICSSPIKLQGKVLESTARSTGTSASAPLLVLRTSTATWLIAVLRQLQFALIFFLYMCFPESSLFSSVLLKFCYRNWIALKYWNTTDTANTDKVNLKG